MRATVYSDSCVFILFVRITTYCLVCLAVLTFKSIHLLWFIPTEAEREREGDTNTQTHSCNSLWHYSFFFCYIFKGAEVTFMFCSFSCQISYLELFFLLFSLILRIIFWWGTSCCYQNILNQEPYFHIVALSCPSLWISTFRNLTLIEHFEYFF